MTSEWLSESVSIGAKSAILLGPLTFDRLIENSKLYSSGVLWISSPIEYENSLPSNIKKIPLNHPLPLLKEDLENFMLSEYDSAPTVKVSKSINENYPEQYTKILDIIIAEIDSTMRARRTREETGFLRQRQIFMNLANYLTKRLPNEWNMLGQGSLGIVVGAGPSLDITLPLLKDRITKPIIVATDSSLRALKSVGLDPDFVVSIDPQKTFDSCSIPNYTPGIAILSSQSHASWSKEWGKRCCFLSGRVITEDWLAEKGISKTSLLAINNAGLTALAFADFLNTSAILTVGLDLAGGGQGQERYAENTNRSHMQTFASHYHDIPGNFSETVPTPFLSDWQETSDYCLRISQKKTVINLNDRGAKLEGATLVHPDQIEELKEALNENLKAFKLEDRTVLDIRKSLTGMGLIQLLTQLVTFCDQYWDALAEEETENTSSQLNFLRNLLSNREFASLLGDFAFSIMPKISADKTMEPKELKSAIKQLQHTIWRLEDAVLECEPGEEFLIRFLTEKFI